jgi:hypothetical protein
VTLDRELAELLDVERFEPPRLLRDIAEGRTLGDVTTLRDPAVMGALEDRIKELQAQED